MRLRVVYKSLLGSLISYMGYAAMAFGIWCFLAPEVKSPSQRLLNHENIHLYQQVELLFVLQWACYLLEYAVRLVLYRSHSKAYRNLSFEREAYDNEGNLDYLKARKRFAWLKYL